MIADLSLHHVAYAVVKCGYTLELTKSDYGYDALIFTYGESGEVENGYMFVQLKATDHIGKYRKGGGFSFPVARKDVDLWQDEPFPVYLILFDASAEAAYWLYFQSIFSGMACERLASREIGFPSRWTPRSLST